MGYNTKIDWCDATWSPVTGCLHGCEYCYARGIARRFEGFEVRCGGENVPDEMKKNGRNSIWNSTHGEQLHVFNTQPQKRTKGGCFTKAPYPYGFSPTFHRYRLDEPTKMKKAQSIFVCSMADLFGEWVPNTWIRDVFAACEAAPQHRYLFLTKNPDRYYQLGEGDDAIIPDSGISGWFGASACTEDQAHAAWENLNCNWISIEPIHGSFSKDFFWHDNRYTQTEERRWNWVVVGGETGNRKDRITPHRTWIEEIAKHCRDWETPIFMKDSLRDLMGDDFRQEFPWEKWETP